MPLLSDADAESFRQALLKGGDAVSLDEAQEIYSRLYFLFERFALWVAKEKANGRVFTLDDRDMLY
jgi:hypothetical protein